MSQIDTIMQKCLKIVVYHNSYKGIRTNTRIQPTKSQLLLLLFFFFLIKVLQWIKYWYITNFDVVPTIWIRWALMRSLVWHVSVQRLESCGIWYITCHPLHHYTRGIFLYNILQNPSWFLYKVDSQCIFVLINVHNKSHKKYIMLKSQYSILLKHQLLYLRPVFAIYWMPLLFP